MSDEKESSATRTVIDHQTDNRFMDEVQKRLDILPDARAMARCDELEARIHSLSNQVGDIKGTLGALSSIGIGLGEVSEDVASVSLEMYKLRSDLSTEHTKSTSLSCYVESYKDRVESLEGKIETIALKYLSLDDRITTLNAKQWESVAKLQELSTMWNRVDNLDALIKSHSQLDHKENSALVKFTSYAVFLMLVINLLFIAFQRLN